jgi:hypothetical protein
VAGLAELLRPRAFKVLPGAEYNRYRLELEEESPPGSARGVFYEVPLPRDASPGHLDERVLPPFARYMRGRRIDPESPAGVVVAVWLDDLCYLLRGPDFVDLFCEVEGLSREALHLRVLRWLDESR